MDRRFVGAVMCGGRSSRFGSDKALAMAGDQTVGARIITALRGGGADPVAAIGGTAGTHLGIPTIPDLRPGDGPLGGLATALLWAKTGPVLVVPCDLPLLAAEHVSTLVDGWVRHADDAGGVDGHDGAGQRATVATIAGEPQVSLALWPAEIGRRVLQLVDDGVRTYRSALELTAWTGVEVSEQALQDADTPEELARLFR